MDRQLATSGVTYGAGRSRNLLGLADNSLRVAGHDGAMQLSVTMTPHWINATVLLPLAHPFVRLDGAEHLARWKHPLVLPVEAGEHLVETFLRYKGFSTELGTGRLTIEVQRGVDLEVAARNGWANHMPFLPQLVPAGS